MGPLVSCAGGAGCHPFRWMVLLVMGVQKGHNKAQFDLAVMLEEGRGQTPDVRKALRRCEKAAQLGQSNAQSTLAWFCDHRPTPSTAPQPGRFIQPGDGLTCASLIQFVFSFRP